MRKSNGPVLPAILGICCCLSLVACRQKPAIHIVGFSQCSDDEWRRKMNTEMQHEAMLHPDIALEIRSVADDTEKQIADIQNFIDRKVDLIIVSPNKAAPVTPVVEKACKSGIPVILVDRKILSDEYTAFIGADNYRIGKEAGNYIIKLLNGKGNVVEIRGLDGSSPATERHQGFISAIDNYPGIRLLSSVDGAWQEDTGENKMEEILAACPEIDVVYAHNDRMATGAYNAAARQNKSHSMAFIGIDALPGIGGGIAQVLDNKLKATFIYPTNGEKIMQLAADILHGKPYEKYNTLYTTVVDETNARVLKLQTDLITEQENKISLLNRRIDSYLTQYATQRYLLLVAMMIVILFSCLFAVIFRAYRSKQRLNVELEKRNEEINRQKDLLEQKRDRLLNLSKQLEEATHAKLVFFTNISHEFRTPLSLISGPVGSLLADKSISGEQRRLLSLAQKSVTVLLKLVDQIIFFRQYENGKLELNFSSNDLQCQLIEWNELFRELAGQKHLRFNFYATENDYRMAYDPEKIERIYFNLLSNAFKYTPEKGFVSVSLNKICTGDGDAAEIKISNSGNGISKRDILNIFDRFYRVDSHIAGSGIGLALTKALVELHLGEIHVESDETTGITTFTVNIPFRQDENSETKNPLPAAAGEPLDYLKESGKRFFTEDEIDKNR
ncbi:MAG: substrate-binding domain-containing protein, partial [Candidatus Symbiothrix sp.]|nr:substrate-binding domain-containing protein [Candidatus Symbiothrix sp.]